MGITFTPSQQEVIDKRNCNVLVSAAAGSGKTAVLTERIIERVIEPAHPVDIDRLLVVTFTNAAAAEMRERISAALQKRAEEAPENVHLQRQMTLLHNAQITTIDKFCLFVIRNNFNDIGLDPAFRIADEGELRLLKKDVMAEVLEERFGEGEEEFLRCIECYSVNGKEKAVEETIEKLYGFAMSYPFPEEWLEGCKEDYHIGTPEELEKAKWIVDACDEVRAILSECEGLMREAIAISELPDGPYMYGAVLEEEREWIERALQKTAYSEVYASFENLSFATLSGKRDESVSKGKRELAKEIRSVVKESLLGLRETYFSMPPLLVLEDMHACAPAVSMLLDLTLQFMKVFAAKKRDRNVIDFADMEHFALQILVRKEAGEMSPSKAAENYRDYFEEILIDEYQDSNLVQEYILQSISKENNGTFNRFMVGDVKQSIYKFRLARPELFLEKYSHYEVGKAGSTTARIDLKQNFRSRKEVIESVNYVFRQIMIQPLGGITYDADAALYPGAVYPEPEASCTQNHQEQAGMQGYETEVLLAKRSAEAAGEATAKEAEALMIAERIRQLVGSFPVTDKESGALRSASYRDIVILLRTNAGWDEVFGRILNEAGIPAYITSKTGYFSAVEVQTALHFLRVLDNPLQDIPLCALLRTPLIGFTDEELAFIGSFKQEFFWENLRLYAGQGGQEALRAKTEAFLRFTEAYRVLVPYTPICELLYRFFYEDGFYYEMSAMPAGEQRSANLDMLLEKAVDFEKTSYHGLFHFVRYMEQMEKYEVDFGEANTLDETADVVRIMSIHKSKGLEFPICIVAGLSKRFNMQDAAQTLLLDMDYGIGTDYRNEEERYKTTTLRKNVIASKIRTENLGEELRILYVAMTRAKEKLILTGSADQLAKKLVSLRPLLFRKTEAVSYVYARKWNCYLDYVLAAFSMHPSFAPIWEENGFDNEKLQVLFKEEPKFRMQIWDRELFLTEEVKSYISKSLLRQKLERETDTKQETQIVSGAERTIAERFSFVYPHSILSKLYTKTTVSELKKLGGMGAKEAGVLLCEEEEILPYIPAFMKETEEISGAVRGSAYHKVLELFDFKKNRQEADIEQELRSMVEKGKLDEAYRASIDVKKLSVFLDSALAKRMAQADAGGKLYKEQPFMLGVPANKIQEEFPEEETILVQGIIDVYFEETDGLVVADYKTDRVQNAEELWSRYRTQLDYYAYALERLTRKKVKEKIIYSFALGKELRSLF